MKGLLRGGSRGSSPRGSSSGGSRGSSPGGSRSGGSRGSSPGGSSSGGSRGSSPGGSRSTAAPLIKSVIFIVITATITTILGLSIAQTGVSATVGYRAVFSDVTGLIAGDDVDIAGVRVGEVTSVSVYDRNRALVAFSVQADHPLPASVTATIRYLNLVGQRYMELGQGAGPVGRTLPPGATIPLSRTIPALNLTELFDGFQPLFQTLSPGAVNQLTSEIIQVFQGESPNITALVATVGALTSSLATKDQVIGQVINNLNKVLHTIASRGTALGNLVTSLQELVSGLAADRQPIGNAISAIATLTSATAGLLQVVRAPLQSDIIQLGRLAANLAANSPAVDAFLRDLPGKMADIARLASYGSWLNFFLCQAKATGVRTPGQGLGSKGVTIMAARCA